MATKYIAGIDEAGRGPLAGPVSISVVVMKASDYTKVKRRTKSIKWLMQNNLSLLKDSKKLTEKQREDWFRQINMWKKEGVLEFSNTLISNTKIDNEGISVVIRKGVANLLSRFKYKSSDIQVMLDGSLKAPEKYEKQMTIIKGDELEPIISLASIVSKVKRDRRMVDLASKYKKYDLEIHKGYGTKNHRDLIKKHGVSKIHRVSFCKNI